MGWNISYTLGTALSYTTTFPSTENPLSEGGEWTCAGTAGTDGIDMQSGSDRAYATGTNPSAYNDNHAILSGFAADHSIECVVYRAGGYTPTDAHEMELLLRFSFAGGNRRGYEILFDTDGNSQIFRWTGDNPASPALVSTGSGAGTGSIADGDVIKASMVGDTITIYKNGTPVRTATDSVYTDGNPGIGSFMRGSGNVLSSFGFASISATDL